MQFPKTQSSLELRYNNKVRVLLSGFVLKNTIHKGLYRKGLRGSAPSAGFFTTPKLSQLLRKRKTYGFEQGETTAF